MTFYDYIWMKFKLKAKFIQTYFIYMLMSPRTKSILTGKGARRTLMLRHHWRWDKLQRGTKNEKQITTWPSKFAWNTLEQKKKKHSGSGPLPPSRRTSRPRCQPSPPSPGNQPHGIGKKWSVDADTMKRGLHMRLIGCHTNDTKERPHRQPKIMAK